MRRRTGFGLGLIATLALGACGQGEVVVVVELEDEGGEEATLLEDVEVRLLPYDRDHVFDSLIRNAPTPEPQIPPELVDAREEIAEAQRAWTAAEARAAELRDTIKTLQERLAGLNRAMNEYNRIFQQLDPMITELESLDRQVVGLFERFDELQKANIEQIDAIRIERENWEDQAFRDVGAVIDALVEQTGLEQHWDTTGAEGATRVDRLAPGRYWVYARYELPYDELYWNIPITVERGDPVVVRLNRANATLRPIF